MTTPRTHLSTPALPGLWIGSLFLVLTGLFGMHGLANHGSCDMPTMSGTPAGQMALPDMSKGSLLGSFSAQTTRGITAATSTTTSVAAVTVVDVGYSAFAPGDGHPHSPGMVGLCLAILASALLTLALSTRRLPVGLPIPGGRRSADLLGLGRDRDPPSLIWLSIRRC